MHTFPSITRAVHRRRLGTRGGGAGPCSGAGQDARHVLQPAAHPELPGRPRREGSEKRGQDRRVVPVVRRPRRAVPRTGGPDGHLARRPVDPLPVGGHGLGQRRHGRDVATPPAQPPRRRLRADRGEAGRPVPPDGELVSDLRVVLPARPVQGARPPEAAGGPAGYDRSDAVRR